VERGGKKKGELCTLFWIIFAAVALADQAAKLWAVQHLGMPLSLIPGWLGLRLVENDGAAWHLLSGQRWLLLATAGGTLGAGFLWRRQFGFPAPASQLALGLLAGGIVGNAVDRLLCGFVVDFIDVTLPFYRWPAFNLADSAICCGAVLLLFCGGERIHRGAK
jgi:signal peptidase II